MKHLGALLAVILIVASIHAPAAAQGFPSPIGVGLPSLGGFPGGGGCSPGDKVGCSAAGQVGYLGYNRGLVFERSADGIVLGGIHTIRYQYPVEGLWVGASVAVGRQRGSFVACDPGDPFSLALGGSWLFANNKEAIESLHVVSPGSRTWSPNTQWYTLYASVSLGAVENFSLVGGFRYDSFSTKFADPVRTEDFASSLPTDEAEISLTSYIPYVGAVTGWSGIELGVIGFPWVPGKIEYAQTIGGAGVRYAASGNYRSGYFLEAFAAWGRQMGVVHLSAFATYTLLHAAADSDFTRTPFGGGAQTAPHSLSFDRQNWIFGGKFGINFTSPL